MDTTSGKWWQSSYTGRVHLFVEEAGTGWAMVFCQICSIPGETVDVNDKPCAECLEAARLLSIGKLNQVPAYKRSSI
jgi:hypothetical protein